MITTASPATQPGSRLELQLDEICRQLQLSQTQDNEAESRYHSVADWLARDGSSLAKADPRIFPQGSTRVGTTVQPQGQDEHDVDLVLVLRLSADDAMALYRAVWKRLEEHEQYASMLELKNRCIRITYAGEFHLDILPARPAEDGPDTWLVVPDRELQDWSPSNPEGHATWFLDRAHAVYHEDQLKRDTEPLPEPEDADAKAPLQRAVQLMKRRRDVRFEDGQEIAPSIILRTLAAQHYQQQLTVLDALEGVLSGVRSKIERNRGVLEVKNPRHPGEVFSDGWTRLQYERFGVFIDDLGQEIEALRNLNNPDDVGNALESMFGETVTKRATEAAGRRMKKAREEGELYAGATGVGIGTASAGSNAQRVRDHDFYGGDDLQS